MSMTVTLLSAHSLIVDLQLVSSQFYLAPNLTFVNGGVYSFSLWEVISIICEYW